jgi:selenocysteine lyase/cysteine desulfurase
MLNYPHWERVKIVACPPCHWTDGGKIDLIRIGEKCRQFGVLLVVDATQAAGAMPLDVTQIRPAFLCASVHKWLFGPYGVCLLYCDPDQLNTVATFDLHEHNRAGSSDDCLPFGPHGYPTTFKNGARRLVQFLTITTTTTR